MMGREGKVCCIRQPKERKRSSYDDSDEDYVLEDDNELDDGSEDFGDAVDGYSSEESFGGLVEMDEENEEQKRKSRKVVRLKKKRDTSEKKKNGGRNSRKRKRVTYEEEVDEEEEEDEDYVDDDGDDDEFTPDEEDDDCMSEDDELTVKKRKTNTKVCRRGVFRSNSERGHKKTKRSSVSKKPVVKKRSGRRLMKKEICYYDESDADFEDSSPALREARRKHSRARRWRYPPAHPDSDIVPFGSSDCEYKFSEEERELMMKANELCGKPKTKLRSSLTETRSKENEVTVKLSKIRGRKGKEKVNDKENWKEENSEVAKQVCGICLSDEDKRRFRGILDCCSHYFCFTCIMEWSKVESRCPLCKQRFKTLTKSGRSIAGVDVKNSVIQVPERDQVYQPTEEEIRSFVDPYESVICSECHEGRDDHLMLLCDLCDSPAHTYCVGLGRQVPEGNWYCDGCRPVALAASNTQVQDPLPDLRTTNANALNSLSSIIEDLEPSLHRASSQGFGYSSSPRFNSGLVHFASPASGVGAPTLSARRQIHRHIQNLLSSNRTNLMSTNIVPSVNMHTDFSYFRNDQVRETTRQNITTSEIRLPSLFTHGLRTQQNPSSSLQNGDSVSFRHSLWRGQAAANHTNTTTYGPVNLTLWPDLSGVNSLPPGYDHQFNQQNSRAGIVSDEHLDPHGVKQESRFYEAKEQLKSMVKSHLKSLSKDIQLGHDTFKDIARSSTHTILAACGLEHRRSEVQIAPSRPVCVHMDSIAVGQTSLMEGSCSSCFDSFVRDVVKRIMDTRSPRWLSLGL